MKAYVLRWYGAPDRLELADIDMPEPDDGEVLVRVGATSVQPYDWHLMRGEPILARLMPGALGLRRPKIRVLGADVAGQVEAVGSGVTEFRPGDEVFAMVSGGGFAEYACVLADRLVRKPANLSLPQAAAVPLAALTALLAVRDQGRVQPGQQVLVNGASGGVGTFAVQLAKAYGAEVTGVCSTRNVDLVRSIGADDVVDYTATDFTRRGRRYDLVVDIAGNRSGAACRRVLRRTGTYVVVGGPAGRWLQPVGHIIAALAPGPFVPQRMAVTSLTERPQNQPDLRTLARLIEDGKIVPVIDRTYPFAEIPAAIGYQEQGHAAGKVVVTVAGAA